MGLLTRGLETSFLTFPDDGAVYSRGYKQTNKQTKMTLFTSIEYIHGMFNLYNFMLSFFSESGISKHFCRRVAKNHYILCLQLRQSSYTLKGYLIFKTK